MGPQPWWQEWTWAQWLVASVTLEYAAASVAYAWIQDWQKAWLFTGYTFANFAFLIWK